MIEVIFVGGKLHGDKREISGDCITVQVPLIHRTCGGTFIETYRRGTEGLFRVVEDLSEGKCSQCADFRLKWATAQQERDKYRRSMRYKLRQKLGDCLHRQSMKLGYFCDHGDC